MITAITAVIAAWLFIEAFRVPERYSWLNRKPFNCLFCLSIWFTAALLFVPKVYLDIFYSFALAAGLAALISYGKAKKG